MLNKLCQEGARTRDWCSACLDLASVSCGESVVGERREFLLQRKCNQLLLGPLCVLFISRPVHPVFLWNGQYCWGDKCGKKGRKIAPHRFFLQPSRAELDSHPSTVTPLSTLTFVTCLCNIHYCFASLSHQNRSQLVSSLRRHFSKKNVFNWRFFFLFSRSLYYVLTNY